MAKKGSNQVYKDGYIQELIEFFDVEPYDDIEIKHYDKDGNVKWVDIKRMPKKLPSVVQFVKKIGVCRKTFYRWIDPESPYYQKEFAEAYKEEAKPMQEDILNQNCLQGLYNPLWAKFWAINNTDMKDETKTEHNLGKDTLSALLGVIDGKTKGLENDGS